MTVVLFGEGMGGEFERGVGQYPTVGDEVHIVTSDHLKTIYGSATGTTGDYYCRQCRGPHQVFLLT